MYFRKKLNCFILFLAFVLLVGCQQIHKPTRLTSCDQTYRPFYNGEKQKISTTDVYIYLNQQNTFEETFQSEHLDYYGVYSMGGGIVDVLLQELADKIVDKINKSIESENKEKNEMVVTINNALLSYNFDDSLKKHVNDDLNRAKWPNVGKIELEHVFTSFDSDYIDELSDEYLKDSGSNSVLFIKTLYYFTKDFNSLLIVSDINMYPSYESIEEYNSAETQHESANKEHCIYKRTLVFQETLYQKMSVDEALQYWSRNNANVVQKTLEDGAREVSRIIVLALNERIDLTIEERGDYSSVSSLEGYVISENNNRILLRTADGKLYSLNKQ